MQILALNEFIPILRFKFSYNLDYMSRCFFEITHLKGP